MPLPSPLPNELVELIAERFRAIGEPTRIRILDQLRHGEASVQELTVALGSSQQNVSKHLSLLQRAGIVDRRRDGTYSYYCIADESVLSLCETVCGSIQRSVGTLAATLNTAFNSPPTATPVPDSGVRSESAPASQGSPR